MRATAEGTRPRGRAHPHKAHAMPPPPPPPNDTTIRSVSIVEQVVSAVGPWSRLALAERSLRRGLQLATPDGHPLDAQTIAAVQQVIDRAHAARTAPPGEPAPTPTPASPLLTIRPAQRPAESALVGAAIALHQCLEQTLRAKTDRAAETAAAGKACRCIERTLPLLIPRLIDAWTALRADARHLARVDPSHTPAPPPITDQAAGPLWPG